METQELLTLEEKEFLVELLKRTIAERKPIFDAYEKYFERREKFEKEKLKLENINKGNNKK